MKQDQTVFFKRSDALPMVEMRRANRSSACYHTHSHDQFSFGVIDAGQADYHNQGQHNHIGVGTTVTINPADSHSCNPQAGNWSYRMLFVDTDWVGQVQQQICDSQAFDYLAFTQPLRDDSASYRSFSQLFQSLLDESNPFAAESLLIEFFERQFSAQQPGRHRLVDQSGVKRVKELIMDRLDSNLSLDQFSAQTGLSRYHLIRSFKQIYGQPPHAFQLNQRINRARTLLREGTSLIDTAAQLGFADQSHFQRNFKKRMALTPKQYQTFFI